MEKQIDKKVLGTWFRGQMALNSGESEQATDYFNQITEDHPDAQRYLALTYYDREEYDEAITEFEIAYNLGDLKALPWLEYAVRTQQPGHPKASHFTKELARLDVAGDPDVLLSLGNIKMTNDEVEESIRYWVRAGIDNWIPMMNLIPYVSQDPDSYLHLILNGKKAPKDEEGVNDFLIKFMWNFVLQGNHEAAVTLGQFLAGLSEEVAEAHFEKLFPQLWTGILFGEPFSLETYHMGALYGMVEHDAEAIHEQYVLYGLEDFEEQTIAGFNEAMGIQNPPSNPIRGNSVGGNWGTDHYYEAAQAAEAEGDQLAELTAWRDLENAGDANGIHNFAISIAREIGVNISFMGVDGETDHAWAPFAAGVIQQDMRPGRDIADLEEIPEAVPAQQSTFFNRVKESLDFNFIRYTVFDESRIAIPYSSEIGVQAIWLHCATIDGLETCILSTTIGLNEANDETGLSPAQLRTIKAMFRNAELIFPNTMIDIGDVFRSIPEDQKPSPFVANIDMDDLIHGRFYEFTEFIPSMDPLNFSMPTLFAGYGISSELTGPHLDEAIQGSCQVLIQIFEQFATMWGSSQEVMELLFPHTPLLQIALDDVIDLDAVTTNPQNTSHHIHALFNADDEDEARESMYRGADLGVEVLMLLAISEKISEHEYDDAAHWADKAISEGIKTPFLGDQLNNLGWGYMLGKDMVKAMRYLKYSAQFGCANAMSTVTWHLLEEGKHQEARDFFDAHYYTIMTSLDSDEDFAQASNMRSNDAVNRWALGASDEELLAIWEDEKFQEGHTESLFYPLLLKWRKGEKEAAIALVQKLPDHVLEELRETFANEDERTGWFAELSRQAREFLTEGAPAKAKKKGFFSRS